MPYEEYYNPADEVERYSEDLNAKNKSVVEKHVHKQLYQKYTKLLDIETTNGKICKRVTIECYGTGQIGSRIKNAVTGQLYSFFVGTGHEDLFFKVIDSMGRNGRKEQLVLFYDTPEQYENHQFIHLDQQVKERWHQKNLEARTRLK
jgi:hypothetical protein